MRDRSSQAVPLSTIIDRSIELTQAEFPSWSADDVRSCYIAGASEAARDLGVPIITDFDGIAACKTAVPAEIRSQLCGQVLKLGLPVTYNGQDWVLIAVLALNTETNAPLEIGDIVSESTFFDSVSLAPARFVNVEK